MEETANCTKGAIRSPASIRLGEKCSGFSVSEDGGQVVASRCRYANWSDPCSKLKHPDRISSLPMPAIAGREAVCPELLQPDARDQVSHTGLGSIGGESRPADRDSFSKKPKAI